MRRIIGLGVLIAAGGCSVKGTWERVRTDPPNVDFPVDDLVLGDDNAYSARWGDDQKMTSQGRYRYSFGRLVIMQQGRKPRTYGARRRLDGTLELRYQLGDRTVKAIMKPKPPQRDESPATRPPNQNPPPPGDAQPATDRSQSGLGGR